MDLLIGIAIGTAFAPFWMMLFTKLVKPRLESLFSSLK